MITKKILSLFLIVRESFFAEKGITREDGLIALKDRGTNVGALGAVDLFEKCFPESNVLAFIDLIPVLEHQI